MDVGEEIHTHTHQLTHSPTVWSVYTHRWYAYSVCFVRGAGAGGKGRRTTTIEDKFIRNLLYALQREHSEITTESIGRCSANKLTQTDKFDQEAHYFWHQETVYITCGPILHVYRGETKANSRQKWTRSMVDFRATATTKRKRDNDRQFIHYGSINRTGTQQKKEIESNGMYDTNIQYVHSLTFALCLFHSVLFSLSHRLSCSEFVSLFLLVGSNRLLGRLASINCWVSGYAFCEMNENDRQQNKMYELFWECSYNHH